MKKKIRRPSGTTVSPPHAAGAAKRHNSARPTEHFAAKSGRLLPWMVVSFLLLVIAIVFGQTLTFGFLNYDDHLFVHGCREVRAGLTSDSIIWAFTNGPMGEWYPLSMLSHMLDVEIFQLNGGGHHFTNVLLHAATAIGLFLLLRKMTGELWPSAFVATVFAIHPQHVESVAWIAERRDTLSGLFFVLTLAAYVGYIHHGRSLGRYLLVAALLSLGLMSKAMLVTVPALLLLLDYWPLGRWGDVADLPEKSADADRPGFGWLLLEKLPLLAIAMADVAATLATHVSPADSGEPWPGRISNAIVSTATYVVQFFYPVALAVFYPVPRDGHAAWKIAGSAVLIVAISAAAAFGRRKYPYATVGWFWFLGMLTPVIGLVHVSDHAMADRYMYLPGIGLAIAVAWGVARLAADWAPGRWVLPGAAALAIVAMVGCATWQTSFWRNDVLLWNHALAVTEDNAEAETSLARELAEMGQLDEAVERYRRAGRWRVDATLRNNLGTALARQGKLDEAEVEFLGAIELDPKYAEANANMGNALALQGHPQQAIPYFRRAIELDSGFALPQFKLANLLLAAGKYDEAVHYFEHVIQLDPDHVRAHAGLAAALAALGQRQRAIAEYRQVLRITPDDTVAREALERLEGTRSPEP
jgi:protein O-mannosyl-transferase